MGRCYDGVKAPHTHIKQAVDCSGADGSHRALHGSSARGGERSAGVWTAAPM